MNDNNKRSLAKHFLWYLCVPRQMTPLDPALDESDRPRLGISSFSCLKQYLEASLDSGKETVIPRKA